jgi:Fic family protein
MWVATTSSGATAPLEPGALRTRDVEVGQHIGPPAALVPALMEHFAQRYDAAELARVRKIVAIGASHHRLAWIHPFRDGNGRVVRLFSDTLIRQLGIDAGGLWSLSRGLAVRRRDYYALLANADQERSSRSADDGRGHLSERALRDFSEFVLKVMLDQIGFMESLFELDTLAGRIEQYIRVEEKFGKEAERIFWLLREALYRGEFPRGDAGRIVGAGERTGRELLARAVNAGLLKSAAPKTPVSLGLPAKVLGTYFPQLFPAGQMEPAPGRSKSL